jgi:uncharacterized membrane protein (DUF441 family)
MEAGQRPSREVGLAVLAIGLVVGLFSGLAEVFGIGEGSFGWKQLVGVIVGAVVALVGLYLVMTAPSGASSGGAPSDGAPGG